MNKFLPTILLVLIVSTLATSTVLSRPLDAAGDSIISFQTRRDGNQEIYVTDPDGRGKPTRVTRTSTLERDAAVSPDGASIAFASRASGNYEIYVQSLTPGSKARRLTGNTAMDLQPTWSPDGKSIAFQSNRSGVRYFIYTVRADGRGKPARLTKSRSPESEPDWSSTNLIAFTQTNGRNMDIAYSDMNGRITSVVRTKDQENEPAWSPNGRSIAYTKVSSRNGDIYTVIATGSGNPSFTSSRPRRLTSSREADSAPTWSPDGRLIAWAATRSRNTDIWVMTTFGSAPRRITTNRSSEYAPSWRAGGIPGSKAVVKPTPTPKPTATPTPRPARPTLAPTPTPTPTSTPVPPTTSGGGAPTPVPAASYLSTFVGGKLIASDGTFLADITSLGHAIVSICDPFGAVLDITSPYGSPFGNQSVFDPAAMDPPNITESGEVVATLSVSLLLGNTVDPYELLQVLGCPAT